MENATKESNIFYSQQPAEKTNFPDQEFDLVLISQSIHWFDLDEFFLEAKRVLKSNEIIAAIGYDLPRLTPEINSLIDYLYSDIIGNH